MLKNIKIEFLNRWGIFKIAEYRYIINRKYGTAYQKTTTSKKPAFIFLFYPLYKFLFL